MRAAILLATILLPSSAAPASSPTLPAQPQSVSADIRSMSPPDARSVAAGRAELRHYVMTVPMMERIGRAGAALRAAERTDPSLAQEDRRAGAHANSYADAVAAIRRHPRIRAFYQRAGVGDRDAVLFPLIVMSAYVADADPTDAGIQPVTPAQLAFYRAHSDRLRAIFMAE